MTANSRNTDKNRKSQSALYDIIYFATVPSQQWLASTFVRHHQLSHRQPHHWTHQMVDLRPQQRSPQPIARSHPAHAGGMIFALVMMFMGNGKVLLVAPLTWEVKAVINEIVNGVHAVLRTCALTTPSAGIQVDAWSPSCCSSALSVSTGTRVR